MKSSEVENILLMQGASRKISEVQQENIEGIQIDSAHTRTHCVGEEESRG